eukprot:TRINITY_DN3387_c0_g1_i1.p1 TRINITY_DN3387_c0_g1~~TRINITY_DN3387_c0_g1_i1.p1  ORF type:complete len:1119 (+),score=244.04 TRINITY_DN3387_c0_g1_i1:44-3400(+)
MDRAPPIRLRVRLIPVPSCFIALPSTFYQELMQDEIPPIEHAWELSWVDARGIHKACVSWAGEFSNEPDYIHVPVKFGELLGLHPNQEISLLHLPNVPPAEQVFVEPLTSDDWEILERHGNYLEEQMLNIACAVFEGLTLPIWIRHNTLLLVKVVSCRPTPCVRLQPHTEVLIAPKLRHQPRATETKVQNGSLKKAPPKRSLRIQPFDVQTNALPGYILVHPSTLQKYAWKEDSPVFLFRSENEKKARDEVFAAANQGPRGEITRVLDANSVSKAASGSILSAIDQLGKVGPNAQQEERFSLIKTYSVARIASSPLVKAGHVMIPDALRRELNAKELTKILVKPIVHGHSPIKSLSLHLVKWKDESIAESVPPAEVMARFKALLQSHSKLPSEKRVLITSGSVFDITVTLAGGSSVQRSIVIYVNGQNFTSGEQTPSPIPLPTEIDGYFYDEPWKHLQRHPVYSFSESDAPKDVSMGAAISLAGPEKWLESVMSLGDFGGMDSVIQESVDFIQSSLLRSSYRRELCLPGHGGLLVTGIHGCGKTAFGQALCKYFRTEHMCYPCYVSGREISGEAKDSIRTKLEEAIKQAVTNAPSLLFIDDLDVLVPTTDQEHDTFTGTQLAEVLVLIFQQIVDSDANVCLFATAQSEASIHQTLRSPYVFDKTINILPPDRKSREKILEKIINHQHLNKDGLNLQQVALHTEGYVGSDLENIVNRAVHSASIRALSTDATQGPIEEILRLTQADFLDATNGYTPTSLKGIKLHKSETTWADVGGMEEVKLTLRETLEWPTKYSRLFEAASLRLRSGLLLFGPPGCGKTMIAGAVAKECGLNFISIKGPELLNKYIGASEQAVRDLFLRASAAKPSILFFDEFDSIAPRRGHDSTGVTDRVVNQLLTQLDGVEGLHGVYVLAATSRPDLIDPALLRPGRLDKSLYCGMPDENDRVSIMKALARKMTLAADLDWSRLSQMSEGRTGADLQAILYNAQLEAIHELIDEPTAVETIVDEKQVQMHIITPTQHAETNMTAAERALLSQRVRTIRDQSLLIENTEQVISTNDVAPNRKGPSISMKHILHAMETTQASVSEKERRRYERIYSDFLDSRGNFNAGQSVGQRTTLA